jgi:hypothetical protein
LKAEKQMAESRKIATAAMFAVIIAIVKGPIFPPPTGDLLVAIEALLLGLSFILLGFGGATFTALIAGLLLNVVEPGFWLFPLLLAILYGVQVDVFSSLFKAVGSSGVSTKRLMGSLTVSSATTGPIAYYATVTAGLVPSSPVDFYAFLIVFGIASGALGAYLAVKLWNRNFRSWFGQLRQPSVQAS